MEIWKNTWKKYIDKNIFICGEKYIIDLDLFIGCNRIIVLYICMYYIHFCEIYKY